MDIDILAPDGPWSTAGGGAIFTQLANAWREAGHSVTVRPGGLPVPGRTTVIDGLALPGLPLDGLAECVALIHHTTALVPRDGRAATREAERERLPRLRQVVATSRAVADRLAAEFGVAADRLHVIEPGVPNAPRSTGSDPCAILSVGALVPRKGHAVLLRALSRLVDLPWTLTIVGDDTRDPATAAALRDQAAAIPGRVLFAGTLDADALEAAWRAANLFALATEWEGYPAAVAEALRRGLPVAVTAGGAAADLVTPDNGIACPPNDADGLSKAMRRLIFDAGLRTDLAQGAWRTGQALPDWPTQAAHFLEVLR